MTLDDLKILADHMSYGPVPTQAKKVYAYLGHVRELLQVLPGTIVIRGSVLDACAEGSLKRTPSSRQKRARITIDCYTDELK
jgi:hypothetical protein